VFFAALGLFFSYRYANRWIRFDGGSIEISTSEVPKSSKGRPTKKRSDPSNLAVNAAPVSPFSPPENGELIPIPETGHHTFRVMEKIERC